MFEARAGGGEPVEVRRLVGLAAVGRDAFEAEVVGHDEDDVGLAVSGKGGSERERDGAENGDEGATAEGAIHG